MKPFLLLGLAAEYRSWRWVWSTVFRRPSEVYHTHWRTKLTAPESICRSRDMVGAHQDLNGSRDPNHAHFVCPLSIGIAPWKKKPFQFLSNISHLLLGIGPLCDFHRRLSIRIAQQNGGLSADRHCATRLTSVGSMASALCWLHQIFKQPFMINRACDRVATGTNSRARR